MTIEAYRYLLHRSWLGMNGPEALFIMLNPSAAAEISDDPTSRKCVGFATRLGCSRLKVVNLIYAWRATNPADLWRAHDPAGPDNDTVLDWRSQTDRSSPPGALAPAATGLGTCAGSPPRNDNR